MKILIFSDIHGNGYALDAFLDQINTNEYEKIIFCGDIFGYYYNQEYVIKCLKKIQNLVWIRGNHDQNFLDIYENRTQEEEYITKYGHSYYSVKEKYSDETFNVINSLPDSSELVLNEKRIGIFHGTPDNPSIGRLYPRDELLKNEKYCKYDYVILGHTHFQMNRKIENTIIINPGSLGQPRDGKGFSYAILDLGTNQLEFQKVEFELNKLFQDIDRNDKCLSKLKNVILRKNVDE